MIARQTTRYQNVTYVVKNAIGRDAQVVVSYFAPNVVGQDMRISELALVSGGIAWGQLSLTAQAWNRMS